MIEDIVEKILKEARKRPQEDSVANIRGVMMDVNRAILDVLDVLREEERREKEDEKENS